MPITWLYIAGIAALYAPTLWEVGDLWLHDESYSHGVFIFPLALFLVWIQRDGLRAVCPNPTSQGYLPLAAGLIMETASYALRIKFLALASLIPVLAGTILLLHGKEAWKIVRFPVYFLLFAAPIPGFILSQPSNWVQRTSSGGASMVMKSLGYPIIQTGNIIELPGLRLEVADVCSGFKKLVALVAFAFLYGYMFPVGMRKRLALVLVAIPIAVVANIIRVSALIAVSSAGGEHALKIAHDWAEIFVLGIAFVLFAGFGKALGCKTVRFSL